MKRLGHWTAAFALLFVLCACGAKNTENTGSADTAPDTRPSAETQEIQPSAVAVTLKAGEHSELNWGDVDGENMIKDFAVDAENLYILQKDGKVFAYRHDGTLEESYDLQLSEQGLTAYRLTSGNGKLYLLDGHNNAVITAEKGKVTNVSMLNFSDVGMVKNFYAAQDGMLVMSFADLDEAYTVTVDPTGEETKIVGEKQRGYLIDKTITYLPQVDEETNQLQITVFEDENQTDAFILSSNDSNRTVSGLSVYGISDSCWFGVLHEFVNDEEGNEEYVQTPVSINAKDGNIRTSENHFSGNEVIELTAEGAYCMERSDDTLTIQPISKYFSDWTKSDVYFLQR